MRSLPWNDLTSEVGTLTFTHGTVRLIEGPKTLRAYLHEHDSPWADNPPRIDFRHRVAVFWAVGPRSTAGYALRIVSVTEEKRRVVVIARERTPSVGDRSRIGLTYPFRLFTIPRTRKPVFLHVEGRP